ncbi:unnamed protein product, partial [Ectocarpus sp. 8 AP-2014]
MGFESMTPVQVRSISGVRQAHRAKAMVGFDVAGYLCWRRGLLRFLGMGGINR